MTKLKVVVNSEDHVQGPEDSEVTLVEYGDYECPHCGRAHSIVKRIQKHFGKRLCFVFRNFPLIHAHPQAESAAECAEFAAAHGKFWEMHDLLFENQQRLSGALFLELTRKLQLSPAALSRSLEDGEFEAHVRADFSGGARSGVNGTPTFFINGLRHNGSFEFADLVQAIDESIGMTSGSTRMG
jgi:protein-disulfide isomerase